MQEEQDLVLQDTALAVSDSLGVALSYPLLLLEMQHAEVEQDSMVTLLLEEKIAGVSRGEQERPGFRVQIYSSNHPTRGKTGALTLEQQLSQQISQPIYVLYASPSWKVRIGDFLNEADAVTFRDEFKRLFPELADYTYIVKDMVKIAAH